jgi:hypothetical protein
VQVRLRTEGERKNSTALSFTFIGDNHMKLQIIVPKIGQNRLVTQAGAVLDIVED